MCESSHSGRCVLTLGDPGDVTRRSEFIAPLAKPHLLHFPSQASLKITFTGEHYRCTLRLKFEEEFWRLVKLLVDAKISTVARRREIARLSQQSLAFIPVVPMPAAPADGLADGEFALPISERPRLTI